MNGECVTPVASTVEVSNAPKGTEARATGVTQCTGGEMHGPCATASEARTTPACTGGEMSGPCGTPHAWYKGAASSMGMSRWWVVVSLVMPGMGAALML